MRRLPVFHILLSLVLVVLPDTIAAHEVEVCLARVAQKSGQLQACKVAQTEAGQCDAIAARLEQFRHQCLEEQHPAEYVARAVTYGAEEVAGNPEQSPYQQRVARQQWQQTQTGPNLQRFSALFPGFEHFNPALMEHFGTTACPNAYEGRQGRWLHAGTVTLQRYSLTDLGSAPPSPVRQHFFAPEATHRCYPVPAASDGSAGSIINIPDQLVQELEKQDIAVRCPSEDCASTIAEVQQLYQQYQGAYREYRQLMVCADTAQRNAARGQVKGMTRSALEMPDFCPEKEIHVAYLNAKGLVEELERRLFNPATASPTQAKATQN